MSQISVVSGYIKENSLDPSINESAISAFDFDEKYPFTNIFLGRSPACFDNYVIGFAGSFKEIEYSWCEWLWKFSQFLSTLEALDAEVNLFGLMGHFTWRFRPYSWARAMRNSLQNEGPYYRIPDLLRGEKWGIYEEPDNDFTISAAWDQDHWIRDGGAPVLRWRECAWTAPEWSPSK